MRTAACPACGSVAVKAVETPTIGARRLLCRRCGHADRERLFLRWQSGDKPVGQRPVSGGHVEPLFFDD